MWAERPWQDYMRGEMEQLLRESFGYAHSWMGVPLISKDKLIGVLRIDHVEPNHFTERDAQLGLAFAHHAAIAIENARLFAEVQHRTQEFTALLNVTRNVAATLELKPLLSLILDQLKIVVDYSMAHLSGLEDEDTLVLLEQRGGTLRDLGRRDDLRDHYNTREMLQSGKPLIAPDLTDETPLARRLRNNIAREGLQGEFKNIKSWMSVPLITQERVVGVLTLAHKEVNYYNPNRAELALVFANQAAVAIEKARAFAAAQRRAEQFRVINEVSHRITSILAVDELLRQTVRLILESFGYQQVHLSLIENDTVNYKASAGGYWNEAHEACCETTPMRLGVDGLAGRVAASGEPLLISDVSQDPIGIALNNAQTGSTLVVPLKVKGRVIGVLNVESERVNALDESDLTVLQSLANQVATAIENAQLYERSQQLAALEERQKLARELHDSVSQALYGIALGARTARTLLERDPAKAVEPLEYVLGQAEAGLTEMRALIFELRPESLKAEGLVAVLNKQAEALSVRHHISIQTQFAAEPNLSLEAKEALYRISQEALHNIAKHAHAQRVELTLSINRDSVQLEIKDDGVGFDPESHFPGHLGLHSMRERAERLGGTYLIESRPQHGARLVVEMPLLR